MRRFTLYVCCVVSTLGYARQARAQATVNENLETAFLYVDAVAGNDNNPGTKTQPLKTIGKSVSLANTNNHNSVGTKVTINPGTYRESLSFSHSNSDTSLPMTFEAATNGTVIVSGSVVYTGWTKYSGNSSIYATAWPNKWGLCANNTGCTTPPDIVLRQEMVAVNGTVLTQVLSLTQMVQGTFYVDVNGGTVYVWPPSGTTMSSATVEVATNPSLINIWQKSYLVIRGITFQFANSCRDTAAVTISGSATNVLFDSDIFQWNNGQGLAIQNPVTYFTVENSTFLHNGDSGIQGSQTKYGLYQSDTLSYNNWRGAQGSYYACNTGGAHFFNTHNDTINTFTTSFNLGYGIHWDTDHENIATTAINATSNLMAGLFSENNQGPITIDQAYVCNQTSPWAGAGISIRNSENVSITNSVLLNNNATQIGVVGDTGGVTISDWETGNSLNVINKYLTNSSNTIQGNTSTQNVFQDSYLGGSDWTTFYTTLSSNNNTWWNTASVTTPFVVPTPQDGTFVDLATWQTDTGQDTNSTFKAPTGNPGSACSLTAAGTDYWFTVDNPTLTTDPSGNAVFNFTVTPWNFTGKASLTLDGISEVSGLTSTLSPSSITTSGTSTLSVSSTTSAAAGTYPVTVIANNGNLTHTSTILLTIPSTSLRFSQASLTFASQQVQTNSPPQSFTIQNFGSKSITVNSFSASSSFSQTNTCGTKVAAGATCTVTVTFTPTYAGTITGTITVNDGDKTSPQVINVSGTGTAAPTATVSPNYLGFGKVKKGTKSSVMTSTLSNTGTTTLTISSVKFTGSNPGDFSQTNNCNGSVVAGGSCTFSVTFTPGAASYRSAKMNIYDNTNSGDNNISMGGTGTN
jgi:hypothetical protein